MGKTYNIYIDETCHLEYDNSEVMCIGYAKILKNDYEQLKESFNKIKLKYKNPLEIKWNKLTSSRIKLYKEWIDNFFNCEVEFKCVLIKNKKNLDHIRYNREDKNSYYYKTLVQLLSTNALNEDEHRVYLDVKDTRGKTRLILLNEELQKKFNNKSPFVYFQHIHSHENDFLQLTDLLIGAICYKARTEFTKENSSAVKKEIINYLEQKSGYNLNDGTEPWETKFHIDDFQIKPFSKL
jgi:hypothetical protein